MRSCCWESAELQQNTKHGELWWWSNCNHNLMEDKKAINSVKSLMRRIGLKIRILLKQRLVQLDYNELSWKISKTVSAYRCGQENIIHPLLHCELWKVWVTEGALSQMMWLLDRMGKVEGERWITFSCYYLVKKGSLEVWWVWFPSTAHHPLPLWFGLFLVLSCNHTTETVSWPSVKMCWGLW